MRRPVPHASPLTTLTAALAHVGQRLAHCPAVTSLCLHERACQARCNTLSRTLGIRMHPCSVAHACHPAGRVWITAARRARLQCFAHVQHRRQLELQAQLHLRQLAGVASPQVEICVA